MHRAGLEYRLAIAIQAAGQVAEPQFVEDGNV